MSMKHYYQNQIVFEKSESRCTAQFLKIVTPSHVAEWAVVNKPMSEYTSTSPATAHHRHNHPRHRFPAYLLETYGGQLLEHLHRWSGKRKMEFTPGR